MKYKINVYDKDGNKIPFNVDDNMTYEFTELNVRLMDDGSDKNSDLSREDILILLDLVAGKINYGVGVGTARELLLLYDKLVNMANKK